MSEAYGSGFRRGGDRGSRGGGGGRGFRGRGRGRGRGDRGRGDRGGERGRGGRGGDRGRGGRGRGRGKKEEEWKPVTKLGRLVKDGRFPNIDDIFLFSIKIKEAGIIDHYYTEDTLKDEVMKIMPVQKQTEAGQRTRFKAWVVIGDFKGHLGLGQKCASEVATSIRGALTLAKLSFIPIRKGYWGSKLGDPHTVPCKLTGKCGSTRVRLTPAPRGTGLVAAIPTKKLLTMAGVEDVYTRTKGQSRTTGNFITALYLGLRKTYKVITPDLWKIQPLPQNPLDKFPSSKTLS